MPLPRVLRRARDGESMRGGAEKKKKKNAWTQTAAIWDDKEKEDVSAHHIISYDWIL